MWLETTFKIKVNFYNKIISTSGLIRIWLCNNQKIWENMQKLCSSYQAQTLEAFWVICHHCQALWCLHPLLTSHKSCFQSNQPESLVSLAANFALWASSCFFAWCVCADPLGRGSFILSTHPRNKGLSGSQPGAGISNFLSLESLWRALGWQGTAAKPSNAGGLCVVIWRSRLCSEQPGVRAAGNSPEGCMEDALLLLATQQGSTGLVLSPVPCWQAHCLQNSADRLLPRHHKFWTNYSCSTHGKCREIKRRTKTLLISCIASISNEQWNYEISWVLL